ncbi:hypothetical protein F3Y22_tig00111274pilonHSYRG00002 [Hibiscus syriacus]|uniref:Uncharacterized protein n=1 Tax=Hibiscus syriacus TaxID=106335 RepID=A0A6A2YRX0_HIBSY|nr:hypothetical protein F3Y22_tig00111274pilonHSYRG00002 [Hibiscus syriacus]
MESSIADERVESESPKAKEEAKIKETIIFGDDFNLENDKEPIIVSVVVTADHHTEVAFTISPAENVDLGMAIPTVFTVAEILKQNGFANRSTTTVMNLHYKLLILLMEHVISILKGLPCEYQPFVAVIIAIRESFSLESLCIVLADVETHLAGFDTQVETLSMSANLAQGKAVDPNHGSYGHASNLFDQMCQ